MSDTVISVENLSKQYRLGYVGTGTLSHDLNRWWNLVRGKEDPFLKVGEENNREKKGNSEFVWALKDINFEVKKGEVLGIIGKNGAGKSTLLKILSRTTTPTTGTFKVKGRIASLLEVGTGFHPELTGRENIFLNGAILGMTKTEIKNKFDEIVDFSGVERYIDTPVKRYSSGMYVRLAFAVAAHLESEILVLDEVLAVGDAEFQKKCLGKMKDVSGTEGRTVLFVSHNMAAVKSLCSRGILLKNGNIAFVDNIDICVNNYLKTGSVDGNTAYKLFNGEKEVCSGDADLISIGIKAIGKEYGDPMRMDEDLEFVIKYNKKTDKHRIDTNLQVKDTNGNFIFNIGTGAWVKESNQLATGILEHRVVVPKNFFNAHQFYINLLIVKDKKEVVIKLDDIITFDIIDKPKEIGEWMGKAVAPLLPFFKWEIISG